MNRPAINQPDMSELKCASYTEIAGWYPLAGTNRGRIKSVYMVGPWLIINIVFCDGAAFIEHTTIGVDRATPFSKSIILEAKNYTGVISERRGRLTEFDYMKIEVEMTPEGAAPWFLRSKLASLKIIPWPVWWDNRPARRRGEK